MYEKLVETLALIGAATCLYLAIEIYNIISNKIQYWKDVYEYRKEIKHAKAQIYYINRIKRGA